MKRKCKQLWSSIPPISTKRKSLLIPTELTEHKKDHNIWCWKSRSWLGTGTKMWRV